MDNYTYYKDEIEKIVRSGDHIAVTVKGNKPICCQGIQCCDCKFNNISQICMDCRSKWLNSEHVEQPTLTQAEHDFLDVLNPDFYIARDRNGSLFLFIHEPTKMNEIEWNDDSSGQWRLLRTSRDVNSGIFGILKRYISFNFIKWEDEKPWKVSDLLELEVKN